MPVNDQPLSDHASGLCATCRHTDSKLERYTCAPWDVVYTCSQRLSSTMRPHATDCMAYEREPGAEG